MHTHGGVFHTINRVIHRCLWMTGLVGGRRQAPTCRRPGRGAGSDGTQVPWDPETGRSGALQKLSVRALACWYGSEGRGQWDEHDRFGRRQGPGAPRAAAGVAMSESWTDSYPAPTPGFGDDVRRATRSTGRAGCPRRTPTPSRACSARC